MIVRGLEWLGRHATALLAGGVYLALRVDPLETQEAGPRSKVEITMVRDVLTGRITVPENRAAGSDATIEPHTVVPCGASGAVCRRSATSGSPLVQTISR